MPDGADIFAGLLQNWAEHMDADVAAFVRPDDGLCVSATNLSAPIHNLDLVLVEMRGDLYRFAHSSRQPIIMNEASDPRRAYIFTDMPFKILCCPVFQGKSVVAVLVLLNHATKPDFSNSDRKLGEVLANHLSSMSRMHSMLTETSKFNAQMAAALIEAVEAKDPYTRGHSERVHHIAMEIGRAMHLPPRELDNLFWGSLLHDVGKIGIPDAVLCKPGRLTRDEFTFIMVHPERSYEILRHIDRLQGAVPGARHHQEKFDGSGYPHGLAGHDIPHNARIIAVADTYDSITSSRAYRAGRSHEVALAEIARCAGTQLDPAIIAVFERVCLAEPEWIARFHIQRDATRPEALPA
jgi:HD-GYP domain-containing protein (c-di-GMP phosphodiesterase class II)